MSLVRKVTRRTVNCAGGMSLMHRMSVIFWISVSLVGLMLGTVAAAYLLGILPDTVAGTVLSSDGSETIASPDYWNLGKLMLFVGCAGVATFYVFLCRVFDYVGPTTTVPDRVRTTLDSLAEGLVVLDGEGRIMMANRSFGAAWQIPTDQLQGRTLSSVIWDGIDQTVPDAQLPWRLSMEQGKIQAGYVLHLRGSTVGDKSYRINSSPMFDDAGVCQGVLVSFDDITVLAERNLALTNMLSRLRKSRDQIHRQNQELQILATRDPLTGAMNRRSLFETFERQWIESRSRQETLACVMIDVDHFKSINDKHGHATGDEILRGIVNVLNNGVRDTDVVARYGGEEFCVLMPSIGIEQAEYGAERLRTSLAESTIAGVRVTASLGLSVSDFGASTPQELLNQADQALYAAKHGGRNCLRRWDQLRSQDLEFMPTTSRRAANEICENGATISFQTVTALVTALAYRDVATAEHSRRVADLCVSVGSAIMSRSECYLLENAALLHDIGNIGVPDAVLLKPGPLNADEWEIINTHDRMTIDLLNSTFDCRELTDIVAFHHIPYRGHKGPHTAPQGNNLPLGARILAIADAYDAMTNERVYRPARSQEAAFDELRRCAGQQFDPELVELFIITIGSLTSTDERMNLQSVNKRTALLLGIQLENLAKALDQKDPTTLANLAAQLKHTAEKCGVDEIAELAECLASSAEREDAWVDNVRMTVDLMELCRLTQRTHLSVGATEHRKVAEAHSCH